MASQTRALVWKEWREQRPLVVTGWIVSLCMPLFIFAGAALTERSTDGKALADAMPLTLALLVWPLLAVACGATTVAGEIGGGTLVFLLSRPASRLRVWTVKVVTGAAALALIVAGSLIVAGAFRLITGADSPGSILRILFDPDYGAMLAMSVWGSVLVLYSAGVFFSTFISRPLTAAAAGLVASLAVVSCLFLLWSRLALIPMFEPELVTIDLAALGALILAGSLFVFTRGELLSGRTTLRTALFGALAVLLGGAVVSVPLIFAQTRLRPAAAELSAIQLVPGGNSVVAAASRADGGAFQAWQIYLDGSGYRPLTGRMALNPTVSPDGRWVAYASQRGPFGLRSSRSSIRLSSLTGEGHHVLADSIPTGAWNVDWLLFSPGSDRVAFRLGSELVVAAIDGSSERRRAFASLGDEWDWTRIRGFDPSGTELIVEQRGRPARERVSGTSRAGNAGVRVVAWDPAEDRVRVLFESDRTAAWMPGEDARTTAGVRYVPLSLLDVDTDGETKEYELVVVDTVEGRTESIARAASIRGVSLDRDSERMIYVTGDPEDAARSIVEAVTFAEGKRERVADVEGRVWPVAASPTGEWVAVTRWNDESRALAVARDGRIVEFEPGWRAAGWWGRDQLVLWRFVDGAARAIGMGDVADGTIRQVFPSP